MSKDGFIRYSEGGENFDTLEDEVEFSYFKIEFIKDCSTSWKR